ncbi:unnamed protein product [Adineta ricciae]|uniref:Uncharacterized protein n=1 Tax=Adineta ricciae TaxID=249248 RepID=A0A815V691_ADIRI|nr:unnamed protein product [Adineta ricciae]
MRYRLTYKGFVVLVILNIICGAIYMNYSFSELEHNYYQKFTICHNSSVIESAPWLLPKDKLLFPYHGLENNLDELLNVMTSCDREKKIVILHFSARWQNICQNNIYTLLRFARVRNYIVEAIGEKSLRVCIELNLPCFNGASYLKKFKNFNPDKEALFQDANFYVTGWHRVQ